MEAHVEDKNDEAQVVQPAHVAPSPATEPTAVHPAESEPITVFAEARAAVLVPTVPSAPAAGAPVSEFRADEKAWSPCLVLRGLPARLAAQAEAEKAEAEKAVKQTLAAEPAADPAPAAGSTPPPPPPAAVTSLADAQFNTGRPEAPESTIGGQSTCIICFTNPKSQIAVPCGHQCACSDCSALMKDCPVCRSPVQMWMQVRVA